MILNNIATVLKNNNYELMGSNVPYLNFFIKKENDKSVNIIGLIDNIDYIDLDCNTLDHISDQIERKFLISNYLDINILYIILSNNVEENKKLANAKSKLWLIDKKTQRLIVYQNEPDDFNSLRKRIEVYMQYYEDHNNLVSKKKKVSIITMIIIVVNVVTFILLEYYGQTNNIAYMVNKGACYPPYIFEKNEYYRLFTCTFMHFNFSHLANNMLSLWILGSVSEKFYGKKTYLFIYLISGIGASFCSALYYYLSDQVVVSVGASGAICGLLGSIAVMAYEDRQYNRRFVILRIFLVIVLLVVGGSSSNVDNVAHIGGFVFGMISSLFIYKLIKKSNTNY